MIGNDSNELNYNFSSNSMRTCFFAISDKQTYILYLMWIFVNTITIALSLIFLRKIYHDISKQMKLKLIQPLPVFYQNNMSLASLSSTPASSHHPVVDYKIYRLKCLTYADLIQNNENNNIVKVNLNNSYSFNQPSQKENKPHFFYFKIDRKKNQSSLSINISRPLNSGRTNSKIKCRLTDLRKKFLQNIKIQFNVIGLFVACLGPLFLVIAIDFSLKLIPANVYRCLCLVAFAAPCIAPLFYMTILIPATNKYCIFCLKIFRTGKYLLKPESKYLFLRLFLYYILSITIDGLHGKKKSELYTNVENYYSLIGKRLASENIANV